MSNVYAAETVFPKGGPLLAPGACMEQEVVELIRWLQGIKQPSERAAQLANWFCGRKVPAVAEDIDSHNTANRFPTFSSFDCATFVYSINALASARSVAEYFSVLDSVRYNGPRCTDNLVHYTINVLRRFIEIGRLREVTSDLIDPSLMSTRTVRLDICGSGGNFVSRPLVGDANRGQLTTYKFIPSDLMTDEMPGVLSGDTLIFVVAKSPDVYPGIVGHLGIAWRTQDNVLSMLHSCKSPVGKRSGPIAGTCLLTPWDSVNEGLVERGVRSISQYVRDNPHKFCGVGVFRTMEAERIMA